MDNPEPQPPLYNFNQRCYTCGAILSNKWKKYCEDMKKITDGEIYNLPIRTIHTQKLLSDNSKTEEGKILDKLGVYRYCCRGTILTFPINHTPIID